MALLDLDDLRTHFFTREGAVRAVDGVDEFLDHFTDTGAEGAEPVGGTVHLHCTDPSMPEGAGEWLITEPVVGGRLEVTREHAKGDAAVRGTASDLVLALWRRRTLDETDRFEVFGDAGRHARSAVGVPVLPLDAPVEVELLVEA